jgi:hypothetical protein
MLKVTEVFERIIIPFWGIIIFAVMYIYYRFKKKLYEEKSSEYGYDSDLTEEVFKNTDETAQTLQWAREVMGVPNLIFTVLDTDTRKVVFTDYGILVRGEAIIPYNSINTISTPVPGEEISGNKYMSAGKIMRNVDVVTKDGKKYSFSYRMFKGLSFLGMIKNIQSIGVPRVYAVADKQEPEFKIEYVDNEAFFTENAKVIA